MNNSGLLNSSSKKRPFHKSEKTSTLKIKAHNKITHTVLDMFKHKSAKPVLHYKSGEVMCNAQLK